MFFHHRDIIFLARTNACRRASHLLEGLAPAGGPHADYADYADCADSFFIFFLLDSYLF